MTDESTVDPLEEANNPGTEPESEILDKEDIDSLVTQASGESEPAAVDAEGERSGSPVILFNGDRLAANEPVTIESYDFRNPSFLGETEMHRLLLKHEEFVRFLEARFALFLRMDFLLSMSELTTVSYEQVIEKVENPSHLVLFRASPMPGMGFLELSPRLALAIASSILGGKGNAPQLERNLTKIEIDLIEEFLILLLKEWCSQWSLDPSPEPTISGHEVAANVLQICEHDTVMLSLSMEAQLRGCSGNICIHVPLYMIEEPVRNMQEQRRKESPSGSNKTGPAWRKGYERIPIQGKGILPIGETSVRDVRENWKPGTIINLPEEALRSVVLQLADIPLFRCEVGAEGDNIALNILEKKNKQEPLWNTKK